MQNQLTAYIWGVTMTQIIDFKSNIKAECHQPMTEDEARLFSIYDVVVGVIIYIEADCYSQEWEQLKGGRNA